MPLHLERKIGERILIGESITIAVEDIRSGSGGGCPYVRLTIDAPRDISVDREEIRASKARGIVLGPEGKREHRTR